LLTSLKHWLPIYYLEQDAVNITVTPDETIGANDNIPRSNSGCAIRIEGGKNPAIYI